MDKRRKLTGAQKRTIIERQGNVCACGCGACLLSPEAAVEFDHTEDRWKGGSEELSNFRALLKGCHLKKTRQETTRRAKEKRIREQGGLMRPKLNKRQKRLQRLQERERMP